MTNCSMCGRELTNDKSVIRGIGPICRAKVLEEINHNHRKVCDYRVEFLNEEKICIIHEIADPENPKISLTNCIEYVIDEIVKGYKLCPDIWSFVEHSQWKPNLFGGYEEWDLVSVKENVEWKYLWHSDATGEKQPFDISLLKDRVKTYRIGARSVINRPHPHSNKLGQSREVAT